MALSSLVSESLCAWPRPKRLPIGAFLQSHYADRVGAHSDRPFLNSDSAVLGHVDVAS